MWRRLRIVVWIIGAAVSVSAQTKAAAHPAKINPKDSMSYVWIQPTTFEMGCLEEDRQCQANEQPRHNVTLTKGYWIGQALVTQAAYKKLAHANPSKFKGEQLPVEGVSWDDAKAYCDAAGMRLPTEAEWENAAHAGVPSARYDLIDGIAWYRGNSERKTHPVGQKKANPYGLYDMLGNVWEWVADWYAPYDAADATDPKGPAAGKYRVLRGGSWNDFSSDVRFSVRDHTVSDNSESARDYDDYSIGFRCAGDSI